MSDIQTFMGVEDVSTLAQAIVDTVAEPLVVLDSDLRVITASRSFYLTFGVDRQNTQGQLLYDLGDGQWDIDELRVLLERVLPEHGVVEGYEVDREFPGIGRRTMRLSARRVFYEGNTRTSLLLTMADVTDRRAMEQEMKELMWQKELLLEEMQHRVANSLTIIASILMLKARTVQSDETRRPRHQHRQGAGTAAGGPDRNLEWSNRHHGVDNARDLRGRLYGWGGSLRARSCSIPRTGVGTFARSRVGTHQFENLARSTNDAAYRQGRSQRAPSKNPGSMAGVSAK